MGNKIFRNRSTPAPAAKNLVPAAPQASQQSAAPQITKCTDPQCPVRNRHENKQYKKGDQDTPKIVLDISARVAERAANNEIIVLSDKKFLNDWTSVHGTSQPRLCTATNCPLKGYHLEKKYKDDNADRPKIVTDMKARAQERATSGRRIDIEKNFLNRWNVVHDPSQPPFPTTPAMKCNNKACPVADWHPKKIYTVTDKLPYLVVKKARAICELWSRGEETLGSDDENFLDKGVRVHGIITHEMLGLSPAVADGIRKSSAGKESL